MAKFGYLYLNSGAVWRRPGTTSRTCSTTSSPGRINPGRIFDFRTDLDHVADAYAAMDERRAIKSLLRISQP